ncbi:MAG: hypothetical protein KDB68_01845 [Planctomycetes bacterium]|nr:hypothetical protein [Planctomycetota bacterium]
MKKTTLIAAALAVVCMFTATPNPSAQDGKTDEKPATDTTAEEAPPTDYLVIAANDLAGVAEDWGNYRAGHGRVAKVVTLSAIGKLTDTKAPTSVEIKNFIANEAGNDEPREGFQVLLLGDCPNDSSDVYDPKVEIPWELTKYMDSNPDASRRERVPTDNFYADIVKDADTLPEIAVGRIPARTVEQATLAFNKVKAYEAAKQGEWLRNLTFFAGEGRFGEQIDKMLEGLFISFAEETIDQAYAVRMTYANINSPYAYAPSKFSDKVIEEANAGAVLLCYLGHGAHDRLDNMYVEAGGKRVRYPILASEDVDKFNIPDGKLPVMMIIACETGHMDHAEGCLAEKICFTEKAPVAVIASSRDSHPYSNTLLQKAVTHEMTDVRAETLGQAFLDGKRELILAEDADRARLEMMAFFIIPKKAERDELNRSHLALYNLTGDPGLRIQYPKLDLGLSVGKTDEDGGISLTIHSESILKELQPEFWVECTRSSHAHEVKKFDKGDITSDDAEKRAAAEAVIAENHANSNDKVLVKLSAEFEGQAETAGKDDEGNPMKLFELFYRGKLDSPLEPGDYILKVFAQDSKGERCGFAATKFEVKK